NMSYLIIGGLSPLSLRGVIPQLLNADETKKVVIYDDLSGGSSSSSAAVLSDPRVSQVVVGSTFNEKLLQKTLTDNEITHVIDLASLSSPKETSPIAIARTAVVGFTHVLDAVRHYGGKPRFVLVSREPSSSRPLSESTPPLPNSLVAANAMAVESMLHSYVISYRMPLVVVRLSEGVLAHDLSRGLNAAFSPGAELSDAAFSAISINDAARGILAVLNKGVAPEIYNIGGEMAVTHKAVSEFIEKIKAGSCCTISSNNPSVFPIERAQKELGWAPEEKNLCEVLKSELTVAAAAPGQLHSFTKVLIFGADQPTGKRLLKALEEKFIPVVLGTSHPGEDPIDTVKEEIYRVAPSNIVFVGDRNEDPAYYDQEPKPARLRENVGKNLHAPWILAAICERVRCHFAYVQTYKEEDEKQETSEGVVKGFTKRLLEQFTSAYQTRFILSENAVDDVNITAIVERIRDNKSSMNAETEKAGKTCTLS
ncbi:hypothetical protein PENTCL1PPCAC_21092, partial [Pristionchus entomophagus]